MKGKMMTDRTFTIKVDATVTMPDQQLPVTPLNKTCSDCSACGKCGKNGSSHLNQAGEALLNLAGGAYTLDQLGTALEIIESLLKQHYGAETKK